MPSMQHIPGLSSKRARAAPNTSEFTVACVRGRMERKRVCISMHLSGRQPAP